jgi:hypothetical protein
MLDSNDSFILELHDVVYVWQGKHASIQEKRSGVTLANKYKTEWNKPKGTRISRIAEGTEDSLFISYFEGYYQNVVEDFGKGKGIDTSTTSTQQISKVANQHLKAASLMLTQLGKDYTVTVYLLEGLTKPVKIEDPREHGKFFAEGVYVVDVQSQSHRYLICWCGPKLGGDQVAKTSEAMDVLCNHELSSD